MRFCMVTTFYPPYGFGGDAIFVQRLSRELAYRGHAVDVIHCADAYTLLGGTRREPPSEPSGIRVHTLKSRAGILWPVAMQQTGSPAFESGRVRSLLDRDYDVIHFHNVSLMGAPEIFAYGRGLKLYTMHEYWLVCPTHVLYRNRREPCQSQDCFRCMLAHRRPPQLWRYTGKLQDALAHVDTFLSLSTFSREIHRERGLQASVRLLPPFVPRASSTAAAVSPPARPYFLCAARLERIKGIHTLIPHFQGDSGPELWIAGSGAEEGVLRCQAAGCPRIRLLGYIEEPRLSELFRNAVAVLVPSLCYEVFPLVILEAFRQGTPVVVRKIGGMTEIVETSGGGLAYQTENDLAGFLSLLSTDAAARGEMGRRGFEAFSEHWTPEAHLKRYFSIIEERSEGKHQLG